MIVKFKCVGKKTALGWADYVLKDKNNNSLDRTNHEIIYDDIKLSKNIIKSLNYKTCATNIVISFQNNVNLETARKAAQDYIYEFLDGFDNAYFINMVEHKDTDNIHYHIQIPKINLKTMTQLEVYNHTRDSVFNKALCKYITKKYDLVSAFDLKEDEYPKRKLKQALGLGKLYGRNIKGKLDREIFKTAIDEYIRNLIFTNKINSLEDIKMAIEDFGDKNWKISRFGEDYKKGSYITIINEKGEKHSIYDNKNGYYSKNDTQNKINNFRINQGAKSNTQNKELEKLEKDYLVLKKKRNQILAKRYKVKQISLEDLIKTMPRPKLEIDDNLEDTSKLNEIFGFDNNKTFEEKLEIIENRVQETYKTLLPIFKPTITNTQNEDLALKKLEIINEKIKKMMSYKITLEMLIQKEKARKEEERMIKELQEELKRINALLKKEQEEKAILYKHSQELSNSLKNANIEIKDLKNINEDLKIYFSLFKEELAEKKYIKQNLTQKNDELKKDIEEKVNQLEQQKISHQNSINTIKNEYKKLLDENEKLKELDGKHKELQKEYIDLFKLHEGLVKNYNSSNKTIENYKYERGELIEKYTEKIREMNKTIEDLTEENEKLKKAKQMKIAKEEPLYYLRR